MSLKKNLVSKIQKPIKTWTKALTHFLYPPFCLHCTSLLEEGMRLFCKSCFSQFTLIDPEERCRFCYRVDEGGKKLCGLCRINLPVWNRAASALDYEGPAVSLISSMKYGNQPYLSKGAAALMIKQFDCLKWPLPDVVVPVPIPLTRWIQRGYNQSYLLAKAVAEMLSCQAVNVLKRKSGDFSQASLAFSQRRELTRSSFSCVRPNAVEDKVVLLVDDVMTTGTTVSRSTEALLEGFPKAIYVLTVCRTVYTS